jgi:transcriptional regulator with XRE-family HTH domain
MSDERSPNQVDQHIGARMRLRRLTMSVSQERLAEMLGLTFQQVQKYEKGVNRVAASRLWDVAKALDVPVSYFFEGLDGGADMQGVSEGSADTPVFDLIASPDGAQLAAAYSTIDSPRVRRGLLELMRALANDDQMA